MEWDDKAEHYQSPPANTAKSAEDKEPTTPEEEDKEQVTAVETGAINSGEATKQNATNATKAEKTEEGTEPFGEPERTIPNTVKDENGFLYYKCRFCGLTFNFLTTLKAHERVHDVQQPYVCGKCGESFHFNCELEYHAMQHEKHKGYKCDCGKTFFQYTELLNHRHPEEEPDNSLTAAELYPPLQPRPSRATIDPAELPAPDFMTKGYEPKYQVKTYSDVRSRPYICQYCSKSYADSRGLAYHMYSHRGERIFNPRASRYLMSRSDTPTTLPGI